METFLDLIRLIAPWLPILIGLCLIVVTYALIGKAAALEDNDRQFGDWPDQLPGVTIKETLHNGTDLEAYQAGASELPSPPSAPWSTLRHSSRAAERVILGLAVGIVGCEALFFFHPNLLIRWLQGGA